MGQRKVYIDFVDGNGYIDISDFVKYDTLSIQETAFNDTFHAAQNTCSFSVIYDVSIYTKITTNTKNLPLRIFDLREEAAIHTEADQPILTENGVRLLIETSVAVPIFAGHIPPKSSRDYNGILDNTIIKINATDNLDYFDMPVGDVLYANCAVMNPSDPANSIVHKLALIAGWTATMVSTAAIPTVIARYSPSDEKVTVRSILDTLLYEYGYTLFLNENGDLAPIQWDRSIPSGTIPEFNEDNIIDEISIENSTQKYDGVKVVYYDLNSVNDMRLYRDSNCGYASDGSFAGFAILDNTDYPPAANTIDETTGNKQIVYQEYTDDAIKYATNKAIQQNLDYNYKNYDSDFTSIVATENYYVDRRFQSPITVVTEAFANKKCQLLYRNTTGSPVLLYYNDVYATIWYKSAEHTAIKNIVTTPSDVYEYTSSYIFNKAVGDELALAIAAQYKNGLRTYEHTSEKDYHCGDIVRIVLSGEGTNTYALVQNKAWDEKDQLYTYSCMSYNPTRETLTSQTVVEVGAINSAESYASIHSIGTPEAVSGAISAVQLALEDQIDGKIACFYQNDAPVSTENYTLCEGDLWFDTNDGNNQYRYNGTNWIDVQDTGIAAAYNLANSKNTIFATLALAQDSAVIGDLFLDNSLMYRCNVAGGAITLDNSNSTTRLTIKNFGRLATAPSSGMIANDTYYNTANETSYYYDGNVWVASATSGATVVTTYTPKYLGIGILASLTTKVFTGATVNGNGVITVGTTTTPNTGDWVVNYSAANVPLGMYVWRTDTWVISTNVELISAAAIDLCNLQVGGITIDGFTTFTTAIIKTLFAKQIKLLDNGKLYSGAGNYNNANTPTYIGADGRVSLGNRLAFDGSDLTVNGTLDTDEIYMKADCQIIGQEYMKASNVVSIDLVSGDITAIKSQLNTLLNSYGVPLYNTGDYASDRRLYCSVISYDDTHPVVMNYAGPLRITNVVDRYTVSGVVKYDIGIYYLRPFTAGNTGETGVYRTIISGNTLVPDLTGNSNALRLTYTVIGSTSYGSHYIEGPLRTRMGLQQRCRGIMGDKDTPFATQDNVFQFVTYLFRIRNTLPGFVYYTISCCVQHSNGYKYAGMLYQDSSTSVQVGWGSTMITCTSGNTSPVDVRFIYV